MPRASKEESERTARRILDVATDHFRARGYGGTDLVTVAAEAGVTRGAVYHHFPSKQALFAAVVANLHERVQHQIETAAAGHDDPWEQLIAGCEAFIDAAIDPAISRILLVEAPSVLGWEPWRALDERTSFASLTDVLQQLEQADEIRPGSAQATARLLSGAMNEAVLWIASEDNQCETKAQVMQPLAVMIRALKTGG